MGSHVLDNRHSTIGKGPGLALGPFVVNYSARRDSAEGYSAQRAARYPVRAGRSWPGPDRRGPEEAPPECAGLVSSWIFSDCPLTLALEIRPNAAGEM